MTALSAFAALIMGIPLTLVLTPLLYALTLFAAEIINHFSPLPSEFWQNVNDLSKLGMRLGDYIINQKGTLDPQELAVGLALLLLPGVVFTFLLWMGMVAMFRHGGVGGALASLSAREPNQNDLKELQLVDVLQEMSIAAGIMPPKLMLVDSAGANAAVIGSCAADARIVLSRRLLDDLNREQLQAVLGNLIASIGNGDLRIAFVVTSVFETCGFIVNLINLPFGKGSRSRIWKIVRYLFTRGTPEQKAMQAAEIAEGLSGSLDANETDAAKFMDGKEVGFFQKIIGYICFPLVFTNLAVELTLWMFTNVLLGPCMALLWRTRQYLADAGAVELTRNADAMASALEQLSEDENAIEGSSWASHLFLLDPKGDHTMLGSEPSDRQKQMAIRAWMAASAAKAAAGAPQEAVPPVQQTFTAADYARMRAEMKMTMMRAMSGDQDAVARMVAMAQAAGLDHGMHDMPNPADIAAAMRGDSAARLRIAKTQQARRQSRGGSGQSGLQMASMVSFHPPLKKRAKRLQRMGAHIRAPRGYGLTTKVLMTVLWLLIGPLILIAAGMMLVLIAMFIMLNLMFLTLWLTAIHFLFTLWNGR